MNIAAADHRTTQLTCPIPGCGTTVTALTTTDDDGRVDIDAAPVRAHAAEHDADEVKFNDLLPTRFQCGLPWEHDEHVYRWYGPGEEDRWVCPGITWQETPGAGS